MRVDRIAAFASAMAPALAGVAGTAIHRLGKVGAKRRQVVLDSLFETFKARETQTVSRLMVELFSPVTPWSEEAAVSGIILLYTAFGAALEADFIWDRGLSAETIANRIEAVIHFPIKKFSDDRGMNRELYGRIDIGFEGITLEGSHR